MTCNVCFSGTNNARLAQMLRNLAVYYSKDPSNLFLVRLVQGLVHLGKVCVYDHFCDVVGVTLFMLHVRTVIVSMQCVVALYDFTSFLKEDEFRSQSGNKECTIGQ